MNKKILSAQIATAVAAVMLGIIPALAVGLNLGTAASGNLDLGNANAAVTASMAGSASGIRAENRGDAEIDARLTSLNDLDARIQSISRISASDKADLASLIQAQISSLTDLKTKIAGDTTTAEVKADDASITSAYRIYLLVVPKGRILAAADRALDIGTSFATLSAKLQADINTASAAGKTVTTLNASLSDLNVQVTNATEKANAANNLVINLAPDNGDANIQTSNTAALKSAKADITAANNDLKTARKDAQSIVAGLKSMNVSLDASASVTTQ